MRLLTIVRRATSSEQHYVCLAVVLSAKDRSLTVSTKEELLQTYCEYSIYFIRLSFFNAMYLNSFYILCLKVHISALEGGREAKWGKCVYL